MGSLSVKIGGVWKTVNNVKVKVNGAWTQVKQVYVKVSGVWTPIWSYEYTASVALPAYKGTTVNSATYEPATTGTQATLVYNTVNNVWDPTDGILLYIYGATFVSAQDTATGFNVHDRTNNLTSLKELSYYDSSLGSAADTVVLIGPFAATITIVVNVISSSVTVKIQGNGMSSATGTISYQTYHS